MVTASLEDAFVPFIDSFSLNVVKFNSFFLNNIWWKQFGYLCDYWSDVWRKAEGRAEVWKKINNHELWNVATSAAWSVSS